MTSLGLRPPGAVPLDLGGLGVAFGSPFWSPFGIHFGSISGPPDDAAGRPSTDLLSLVGGGLWTGLHAASFGIPKWTQNGDTLFLNS